MVGSVGSINSTETVPGKLDDCQLNTPTAMTISINGTILVSTDNVCFRDSTWRADNDTFLWALPTQKKSGE